jgi:hypothetical protein
LKSDGSGTKLVLSSEDAFPVLRRDQLVDQQQHAALRVRHLEHLLPSRGGLLEAIDAARDNLVHVHVAFLRILCGGGHRLVSLHGQHLPRAHTRLA